MQADYQRCLKSRESTNSSASVGRIWELALGDFLAGYRPSRKIKDQLLDITKEAIATALAIGAMRDYTCYSSSPDSIRSAGCYLVRRLAYDLYNVSAKLTAIADSVAVEETTKLQDWLARDEDIARIGRGAEAAANG